MPTNVQRNQHKINIDLRMLDASVFLTHRDRDIKIKIADRDIKIKIEIETDQDKDR